MISNLMYDPGYLLSTVFSAPQNREMEMSDEKEVIATSASIIPLLVCTLMFVLTVCSVS
jgi:hypothetical protein